MTTQPEIDTAEVDAAVLAHRANPTEATRTHLLDAMTQHNNLVAQRDVTGYMARQH